MVTRNVQAVNYCLPALSRSTTAELVAKAFALIALHNADLFQKEVGERPLSESVMAALMISLLVSRENGKII